MARTPKVEWFCEKCGKVIGRQTGWVWLDLDDVDEYVADLRDGLRHRGAVAPRWMTHHQKCIGPGGDADVRSLRLRVEDVSTIAAVMRETEALMNPRGRLGEQRLAMTDWLDILRELTYGAGRWPRDGSP